MGKKNKMHVGFMVIAMSVLVALCALPCGATTVNPGDPYDLSTDVEDGYIIVRGTLNLYPGAYVEWFIWAYTGTIDIYGCELGDSESELVSDWGYIWFLDGYEEEGTYYPPPDITVYGTDFEIQVYDWQSHLFLDVPLDSSATQFAGVAGDLILLTGNYIDGSDIHLLFDFYTAGIINLSSSLATPTIAIDIKPGSDTNPINLKSKGLVPVAILGTEDFAAITVIPETVFLEGVVPPVRWTMEDVDGDGIEDMLLHFKTQELKTVLTEESTEATLTAETTDGVSIEASDAVQIVPSKSK